MEKNVKGRHDFVENFVEGGKQEKEEENQKRRRENQEKEEILKRVEEGKLFP